MPRPPQLLARLTLLGLVAVLFGLAGCTLWSVTATHMTATSATTRVVLSDTFARARYAVAQDAALHREYLLDVTLQRDQGHGLRRTLPAAAQQVDSTLTRALRAVDVVGSPEDRALAAALRRLHRRYHAAIAEIAAALGAEQWTRATAIEEAVADPLVAALDARAARAAQVERDEALASLRSLQATQIRVTAITAGVFAAGLLLLALLSWIAHLARRRILRRFRALTEHATDLVSIVDAGGAIRYASPSYQSLLGYAPAALQGHLLGDLLHPDDRAYVQAALLAPAQAAGPAAALEARVRHADGSWRTTELRARNCRADPDVGGIIIRGRDVTERTEAERERRRVEERFRALLEAAPDAIVTCGAGGRIVLVNAQAEQLFGYDRAELLGQPVELLLPTHLRARHIQHRAGFSADPHPRSMSSGLDLHVRTKDGREVPVDISLSPLTSGGEQLVTAVIHDISARKEAEVMLRHQALHDALTDLPNRTLLLDRLQQALLMAQRDHHPLALLLLDLDRFKEINDTFGHNCGDQVLQQVARRLQDALRAADTVARLGGDEFAVLLPGADADGARRGAQALRVALDAPIVVGDQAFHITASIGIVLVPTHGEDVQTLVRHADVAMYTSKRADSGYAFYDAAQDQHSPERLALITDLSQAIACDQLLLHYQPKVEIAMGRVVGVEALVRWPHPQRGLVPPDQFISLAEQHGLIKPLTRRVLEMALRQCRDWRRLGRPLDVAVNLSMANLHDPHLVDMILSLLDRYAVPPASLRLELTESSIMTDTERSLAVLTRLSQRGVRLSVDDFGTGYSSLAYLKRLPVDELKIDRSFVRDMATDEADAAIVHAIIELGHSLGLRVVAEGVEDQESWNLLARLGCDMAQGYYLSRPLPATALEQWWCEAPWAAA